MVVAVGIDEDLEVVVVKDDRVVLGERGPDVRLVQLGGDVEVARRPRASSRACRSAGAGLASPSMSTNASVHGAACQAAVVEPAVDGDGDARAIARHSRADAEQQTVGLKPGDYCSAERRTRRSEHRSRELRACVFTRTALRERAPIARRSSRRHRRSTRPPRRRQRHLNRARELGGASGDTNRPL